MGFLSRILWGDLEQPRTRSFPKQEKRSSDSTSKWDLPEDWLLRSFGASGVAVNAESAMNVATVYACVRILAEGIATLPVKLYQKRGDKRQVRDDLNLCRLLKDEPNDYQTAFEFKEMMQGHLGVRGNALARIVRDGDGIARALEPWHPGRVKWEHNKKLNTIIYNYDGQSYDAYQVLHLKGLTSDGFNGLSPIGLLRDTIGLALQEQKHGLNTYSNGAKPGGILETDANLNDDQIKLLKAQWDKAHSGSDNTGKTAILQGGMKWKDVGFTNVDAQFLESRKFSVEEIARAYRIPLYLLQSTEKSTSWGSGIEQQNLGYLQYTLQPWLTRWEQALNRMLLSDRQKNNGFYFKFNLDALLRGDFKTRMEGYRTGIESGIFSRNEVRKMEDMNPIGDESGDDYYRPLNTVPADQLTAQEETVDA